MLRTFLDSYCIVNMLLFTTWSLDGKLDKDKQGNALAFVLGNVLTLCVINHLWW